MDSGTIKTKSIKWDCLFTWIFKHLKQSKDPPLCEIPEDLNLKVTGEKLETHWKNELKRASPSFVRAIFKFIWKEMLISCLLHSAAVVLRCLMAVIIKEIIDYKQGDSKNGDSSNLLIFGTVGAAFLVALCRSNSYLRLLLMTGNIKACITTLLTKKTLKIKCNQLDQGKIMNLLSGDLEVFEFFLYTPFAFETPICILVSSMILNYIIGSYALIGIGLSIAHIPAIFVLSLVGSKIRSKISKISDRRIKFIVNLVEGIKIFKLYAWELIYTRKISEVRKKEINQRYCLNIVNGLMVVLGLGGISLTIFVTFYINLIWLKKTLTLGEMYLIIIIYLGNHLSIVNMNTIAILTLIMIKDVLKRIGEVLLLPEINMHENNENFEELGLGFDTSILFKPKKNSLYLETEQSNIDDIDILGEFDFEVKKGSLLIIAGATGSGKTTFLRHLQQEVEMKRGCFVIKGKLSYCSQNPWILSATIEENILMGNVFNEEKYFDIIQACSLDKDIESFINKVKLGLVTEESR